GTWMGRMVSTTPQVAQAAGLAGALGALATLAGAGRAAAGGALSAGGWAAPSWACWACRACWGSWAACTWASCSGAWPEDAAQGVGSQPTRAATATAHRTMTDTAAVATSGCRPRRGDAPGDAGLFMMALHRQYGPLYSIRQPYRRV